MKQINKNYCYIIFLSLLSFCVNFFSANNGVLPIDTFLHYDSASNILGGAFPVKNYWIVHGLTLDYMQAFFFKIFGVNWFSYVLHSSIFNVLITIATFNFLSLINLKKIYAFLLASSFSILAYPVSGTPFIDHHAIFFCLFSFYLFFFGIKNNLKYIFLIPTFFGLAFFSKPVPSIYLLLVFILILTYYLISKKNLKLLKNLTYGSIFFIIFLLIFFITLEIDINLFLTQLIYYPASIGQDRILMLNIDFSKIISNYKFILIPLIITTFLFFNLKNNRKIKDILFLFIVFLSFNLISIYHQILTKNQNFIFFLIPLNLGFLILILENCKWNKKKTYTSIILIFIFCFFTTLKYYDRFIIKKKFHDLQNTNLTEAIPANQIHNSLNFLNWKTMNYEKPIVEVNLIKEVLNEIKVDESNILLMTNYNFISSASNKKTFMLSRTYDDISFPSKKNVFYNEFRKFYLKQLTLNNISKIYLVFDKSELEQSKKRYIYEYIDQECFKSQVINDIFIKMNLNDCKSIK